jgi:hypothetical protein
MKDFIRAPDSSLNASTPINDDPEGRREPVDAPRDPLTPGQFFRRAAICVGICLVLGWLAPFLISIIGRQ